MTAQRKRWTPEQSRYASARSRPEYFQPRHYEHAGCDERFDDGAFALGTDMVKPQEQASLDILRAAGHEMRTPLNAIGLWLEVLRRAPAGPEQAQPIDAIGRQLEVLSRLAEDLLCAARLPSWKERLLITRVDLNDAARAALETCRGLVEERCHRVVAAYHFAPLMIEGDATRLGQIVVNLIDNAVKYTPRYGRIILKTSREGSQAVLSVRDNGIGIAPDKLKRVFDPFVQVGDPRAQHGGIGLGLVLVKRWVALHGGTIKAHSQGGDLGSEFVVRFPLLQEARAEDGSIQPEAQGGYVLAPRDA
jgi:signal transduction histidine kinase